MGEQSLVNRRSSGPGCVPEKPKDTRQEADFGLGEVELPVGHRRGVGAELGGDIPLPKFEVQPALAQVVADRAEFARVGRRKRSKCLKLNMAERQRGDAGRSRRGA